MKKQPNLPDKPSQLVLAALGHMARYEKNRRYTIRMDQWFTPDYEGTSKCAICFAGCLIAGVGLASPKDEVVVDPSLFDAKTNHKLQLLNELRYRTIPEVMRDYYSNLGDVPASVDRKITRLAAVFWKRSGWYQPDAYGINKRLFKLKMRRIGRLLASVGL